MVMPDSVAWMKPSGHGPSAKHLVQEEDEDRITTYCGRSIYRDREVLDENEAGNECKRCVGAWRRSLLGCENLTLEEMGEAELATPKAVEIMGEKGLEPADVEGTGRHGRVLVDDARKAARAVAGEKE